MNFLRNESGSILIFFTLMVVLLLIMVGLGLDTGWVAYTRSQGQPAVDAAALVGASGVPTGSATEIKNRIEALNTKNDYVKSLSNPIDGTVNGPNVTLISYDFATGNITKVATVGEANGVRVGLEQNNPYGGNSGTAINTPLFLTPLLNWFGAGVSGTSNVDVSAVAVATAIPSFPVVITGCPGYTPSPGIDPWCEDTLDSDGNVVVAKLCAGGCTTTADGKKGTKCSLIRNPNPTDSAGWTNLQMSPPVSKSVVEEMLQTTQTCENAQPGVQAESNICLNNGNIPVLVSEIDSLFGPFNPVSPNDPDDCFLIPVIGQDIAQITSCTPVKQFARICIREVFCPQCAEKPPQGGVYQQQVIADIECPYTPNLQTNGCFSNKLVRDAKSGM
jgi:Flp pilus assembly protein TadG